MRQRTSLLTTVARALEAASAGVNKAVGAVTVVLLGCLVVVVGLKITARYLVSLPMPWTEEVSKILLTWIILLGISVAFRHGELVASYYLVSKLRRGALWVAFALIQVALVTLLLVFLLEGWSYAVVGWVMETPILRMRIFYQYVAVPLCAALCLLHEAAFVLNINGKRLQAYIQQETAIK